jgi:hypothetical protein
MSSSKLKIKRVKIPERVLIAGKWWKLSPLSIPDRKKLVKKDQVCYGATYLQAKLIKYYPVLHKEELLDTLLHEGLHAIRSERSTMLDDDDAEEDTVSTLVVDIMTFLKQIATIELKAA